MTTVRRPLRGHVTCPVGRRANRAALAVAGHVGRRASPTGRVNVGHVGLAGRCLGLLGPVGHVDLADLGDHVDLAGHVDLFRLLPWDLVWVLLLLLDHHHICDGYRIGGLPSGGRSAVVCFPGNVGLVLRVQVGLLVLLLLLLVGLDSPGCLVCPSGCGGLWESLV